MFPADKPITLADVTYANHSAAITHFKTLLKNQVREGRVL
jgi:hypothetical protein